MTGGAFSLLGARRGSVERRGDLADELPHRVRGSGCIGNRCGQQVGVDAPGVQHGGAIGGGIALQAVPFRGERTLNDAQTMQGIVQVIHRVREVDRVRRSRAYPGDEVSLGHGMLSIVWGDHWGRMHPALNAINI